jgi:hypothetical protein
MREREKRKKGFTSPQYYFLFRSNPKGDIINCLAKCGMGKSKLFLSLDVRTNLVLFMRFSEQCERVCVLRNVSLFPFGRAMAKFDMNFRF